MHIFFTHSFMTRGGVGGLTLNEGFYYFYSFFQTIRIRYCSLASSDQAASEVFCWTWSVDQYPKPVFISLMVLGRAMPKLEFLYG